MSFESNRKSETEDYENDVEGNEERKGALLVRLTGFEVKYQN